MARPFIPQQPSGELLIEEYHSGFNEVYFIPPKDKLIDANLKHEKPKKYKKHLLSVNGTQDYISIYPLNTLSGHKKFLKAKYESIQSITLEGFNFGNGEDEGEVNDILDNLPSGFIKDYDYGLGLLKEYIFLIDILEGFEIEHLVISKKETTAIDEETNTCTLYYKDFETIRKSLNRITNHSRSAARKVKLISTNNYLSSFLNNKNYPIKSLDATENNLNKLIAKSLSKMPIDLTKSEQSSAINIISKNKKSIAQKQPESLMKLRNDIDLVTLEVLISKYKENLQKNLGESYWQKFFSANPFILSLVFSFPIIKVQEQFFVGGRKATGAGDKIADFLIKNSITNNTAIIEIKTPKTKLLNKKAYRNEVYTPSSDLSGAVNQVIDQQYQFKSEISSIKNKSRLPDIETYSVYGILIIGMLPKDLDKQKSLEHYRGNSKSVSIITFDELLVRLEQLHTFLCEVDEDK